MLLGGKCGTIDSIGIEALLEPEVTYNFEVADYHTYYVGECNVLVHNMCRSDKYKIANKDSAGRRTPGRRTPNNLNEELAMRQAQTNPLDGKVIMSDLKDPRWLSSDGWVKMQQTFNFYDGTKATIHYVINHTLKLIDDFKFVFPR